MKIVSFLLGVFGGLVIAVVVGLLVLPMIGVFDMTATGKTNILDWWGHTNLEAILKKQSPKTKIPATVDLAEGFEHYKSTCLHCHGGPNAPREIWAHSMLPLPPELWKKDTQEAPDGELFYIINGGIHMSGMPAFGPGNPENDIWDLVAIIRQLNELTDSQQQELQKIASFYGNGDVEYIKGSETGQPVQ